MRFKDKIAIVTGAASGIGRATARKLASEGARVVLADRDSEGNRSLASELGSAAFSIPFDVSDPAACQTAVDTAIAHHGRLDIVCNAAGVLRMAPLASFSPEEWNRIISVNLSGTFFMCQAAMPKLVESRGCIVNIASAAGLVGVPFNAPYVASKHGIVGLTRALALEFANAGVRVNAICPTGVNTPMLATPPDEGVDFSLVMRVAPWLDGGALCDPEDIADAVIYLASAEAKRVTGVAFPVDGGQTAF